MSTSELQGLQLPSFWNRNIDGIQALMDHTTFLAKIVQWLSFLFPGNSVCFLVCLSTTYLQTAMIWSHAVLLGLYHGLLGTFCSSLARPTTARKGGTTLGKRWAGTQMQGLRDWSHIPTVATKADSCVKQNQIKKNEQSASTKQSNKGTGPNIPICPSAPFTPYLFFKTSRCLLLESHLHFLCNLRRIFGGFFHPLLMFFGLCAAQDTSEKICKLDLSSWTSSTLTFQNDVSTSIGTGCFFLKLHFEIRIKDQRKFSSFKVLVQELKTFEVSQFPLLFPLTSPYAFSEAFFASSAKSGAPSARANRT